MPKFKSEEEAIKAHKNYHFDTDHEGKFSPRHTGWLRTKQLIDWIPNKPLIFLGIGCNTGGLERLIMRHKRGSIAYGIDVCESAVICAKGKGIIATVNKAEAIPYKDNKFDLSVLSEILEHVYDPKAVLNETIRVTKPGGLIIGSVPHPEGLNTKKRSIEEHEYHTRVFTKQTLKELLSTLNNLEIVDIPFCHCDILVPQWMAWRGFKK